MFLCVPGFLRIHADGAQVLLRQLLRGEAKGEGGGAAAEDAAVAAVPRPSRPPAKAPEPGVGGWG